MTSTSDARDLAAKVSVPTLTAIVIGSMIGGGVFTLPSSFGASTGVVGALVAWSVAGFGMLMLAFVFESLAVRRPDLDSGIYVYAQAGFGNFAGFNAAWGYWASNVVGNVFYLTFAMAGIGAFLPGLSKGTTVVAVLCSSALIWLFHALILRGIHEATAINRIVTVAKVIPILVFIVVCGFAFDAGVFRDNLAGSDSGSASLFGQVTDTMVITAFVFLGIEGASVYSRLARRRRDVGRATVLGFVSTLAVFASVTLVSYGVLPQKDLASADAPSMGVVLESVVGPWGATLINGAVVVSVLGAYLAWTLLNAEIMFMPARTEIMPRFLTAENSRGVPTAALLTTNLSVQAFLLLVLVVEDALDFMLSLDVALTLLPYLLAALYAVKLAVTRATYESGQDRRRRRDLLVGATAAAYSTYLLYAAGLEFVLLGCMIYAPGIALYVLSRREHGDRVFTRVEAVAAAGVVAAAIIGVVLLGNGTLTVM